MLKCHNLTNNHQDKKTNRITKYAALNKTFAQKTVNEQFTFKTLLEHETSNGDDVNIASRLFYDNQIISSQRHLKALAAKYTTVSVGDSKNKHKEFQCKCRPSVISS